MTKYKKKPWSKLYKRKSWQLLRQSQLSILPYCEYCQAMGSLKPAEVVDHITPHKGDEELFFNADNLQSLCKSCHDMHKQRQESGGVLIGGDTSGAPVDPHHHWNK